jgi:hypothetical protein
MDDVTIRQIAQVRSTAEQMSEAALEAIWRGDVGLARTAARQAAQYARMAMELATGARLDEPEKEDDVDKQTTLSL